MDDELIHILRCIWESEPGDAIAAGFGGSEGDVEEGDVCRGENGEVVGHFFSIPGCCAYGVGGDVGWLGGK